MKVIFISEHEANVILFACVCSSGTHRKYAFKGKAFGKGFQPELVGREV